MLLARRNLLRDRTRLLLSVLGVAVSVALILVLAGYRSGVYRQSTAYLENTPGDLVIAARGVRDFLGTTSVLPSGAAATAETIPGVDRVIPVVAQFVVVERHGRKDGYFLIGYDPEAGGGPWRLVAGREPRADDELVIDRTSAAQHGISIGDRVGVLDRMAMVVGLSDQTTFWAGSIAFAPIDALESLLRAPGLRSFLLVTPGRGVDAAGLRERLALALPGTEVLPKAEVVANDRRLMARVYDAPIGLMVAIAFVVGVLVVGLVVYTATVERRREYGAIKAIGARNRTLYRVVTAQALIAAGLGAIVGVVGAFVIAALLMSWRPQFLVDIDAGSIGAVLMASLLMAVLAAVVPAWSVARLEPAEVFRG